jgi:hypothetical protein
MATNGSAQTQVCSACSADLARGPVRRDSDGNLLCRACWSSLRRDSSAAVVPVFGCAICGTGHPVDQMKNWGGQFVCNHCHPTGKTAATGARGQTRGKTASTAVPEPELLQEISFARPKSLRPNVLCPHCWNTFAPGDVLWIAQHADLLGDPLVGPAAPLRFLPSRFDVKGSAIDASGMPCQAMACPRCHLAIPRHMLEMPPFMLSIVGAAGSGKSHFLACMTFELRRRLPESFGVGFADADLAGNPCLNRYEQTLFPQDDADRLVSLEKTPMLGDLYESIHLGSQTLTFPRPFLFSMLPKSTKKRVGNGKRGGVLCMYDNAGEHFEPGSDSAAAPVTHHLAKSRTMIFVYDPTQNLRFREQCRKFSDAPQLDGPMPSQRQEAIFIEAAARVRKYTGLPSNKRYKKPLIVVVSKYDLWKPLLSDQDLLRTEPILGTGQHASLDVVRIKQVSSLVRELLRQFAPEMVLAAEAFCSDVTYIPFSSLGRAPSAREGDGALGIRAGNISPKWVTIPVLYALGEVWPGLISMRRAKEMGGKEAVAAEMGAKESGAIEAGAKEMGAKETGGKEIDVLGALPGEDEIVSAARSRAVGQ